MVHPDLDALTNHLLALAKQQISRRGGFFPFAASMTVNGEIRLATSYDGDEHLETMALVDFLLKGLRHDAETGKIRAAGICVDTRVASSPGAEKSDAVCAQLEHADGLCVDVFLPYYKGFLGRVEFEPTFATSRESRIFQTVTRLR